MKKNKVVDEIKKSIGKKKVSTKKTDLYSYPFDFWPITLHWIIKDKYPTLPIAVIWPNSYQDIQKTVKICKKHKIPVYPFGGGSGVLGGTVPKKSGVVIDLKKLRDIKINKENLLVEVDSGVNGFYLEDFLNYNGFTLGNIPQSLYPSTVGGWVGTKATGQFSTRYGGIEQMIAGIEAVLPSGEKIELKPHPRTATGPDIRQLFVGSEGIFGIITKVWLKIWPYPEKKVKLSFVTDNINEALNSVKKVLQTGARPAVVRIYDKIETKRHFYNFSEVVDRIATVFIVEGNQKIVDTDVEIIKKCFKSEDLGEEIVNDWLKTRFNVKEAAEFVPMGVVFDTIEVAVGWDKAEDFYENVSTDMKKIKGVLFASAHASHFYPQGVCFYFTFAGMPPRGKKHEDFYQNVWKVAMDSTLKNGGTISHHHGIGRQRGPWMSEELGDAGFKLLKKLKKSVDSDGIMNPGDMGV